MLSILIGDTIELIQITILTIFLINTIRRNPVIKSSTASLYVLGTVVYIVSDLYWIVHLIVKEGETPSFSAVEIGIAGVFIFYGAAIHERMKTEQRYFRLTFPVVFAALFTLLNTICWILWTSGVVRDSITGIAMGYFACVIAARMEELELLKKENRDKTCLLTGVLMFLELGTVYASGNLLFILDIARYVLWFAGVLYFAVLIYKYVISEKDIEKGLCSSFAAFLWSAFAMYLSAGVMYQVFSAIVTLMMIPMYLAVRREEKGI